MNKIQIAFYSGAGSTQAICRVLGKIIGSPYGVSVESMRSGDFKPAKDADLLVLAFPSYHARPPRSLIRQIKSWPVRPHPARAYLICTCGLFSGNTSRIVERLLKSKNIRIAGYKEIYGPATDGVLFFPAAFRRMFQYSKSAIKKLIQTRDEIMRALHASENKMQSKPLSWLAAINFINQTGGLLFSGMLVKRMRILPDHCTGCSRCIGICPNGCFQKREKGIVIDTADCDFCYRCVHHCPEKAIVFGRWMRSRARLDSQFWENMEKQLMSECANWSPFN